MQEAKPTNMRDTLKAENAHLTLRYEAREPIVLLSQAFNLYAKSLEKVIRPAGLTVSQWVVLWALFVSNNSLTPTELSRLLPIETNAVTPLLDRLKERKLVSRRRSQTDRRKVVVSLTVQGEQLVRETAPNVREMDSHTVQSLSVRELRQLSRLMRKIRNASASFIGAHPDRIEDTVVRLVGVTPTGKRLRDACAEANE